MKHDDIKEDKKLIKKAFSMHDKQEHPGKKTNLSKLKKGGPTGKDMRLLVAIWPVLITKNLGASNEDPS